MSAIEKYELKSAMNGFMSDVEKKLFTVGEEFLVNTYFLTGAGGVFSAGASGRSLIDVNSVKIM